MYGLKKMTQKISKTYTLSFPKAAHSLEAQDQGVSGELREETLESKTQWRLYGQNIISDILTFNKLLF